MIIRVGLVWRSLGLPVPLLPHSLAANGQLSGDGEDVGTPRPWRARFARFAGSWTAMIINDRLHHEDYLSITMTVRVLTLG
ncbi:hypothetical protein DY240_26735 [Jiangella rhizosphaerae]|uniref:Uncharacterized protein n=1 Tax=Jiangella rhizosphaerae TaxID=2293569 RepID=A0A418KI89_9ACTN|nr:hypothetical protein DY240_26735 [Jiangella rhizosphaerae]